jgi:hypothetical protein
MHLTLTLNNVATRLAIWTSQHAAATRLLSTLLPVTIAMAAAIVTRNPYVVHHVYHIAPACGSGSGGSGGC